MPKLRTLLILGVLIVLGGCEVNARLIGRSLPTMAGPGLLLVHCNSNCPGKPFTEGMDLPEEFERLRSALVEHTNGETRYLAQVPQGAVAGLSEAPVCPSEDFASTYQSWATLFPAEGEPVSLNFFNSRWGSLPLSLFASGWAGGEDFDTCGTLTALRLYWMVFSAQ